MQSAAVKSAKRTMEILELMESVRGPVSLKDVSSRLGYPISSSSVLLKSLVYSGYLHYDRFTRTYVPTTRLTALGNWVPDSLFGTTGLPQAMKAIHETCGDWIAVGAMADASVQYLHVVGPHRQGRIKSGASHPLTDSALGIVLLGGLGDRAVEAVWRRTRYLSGDGASGSYETLAGEVAKARATGHAFVTMGDGVASLAMRIPGEWHGRMLGLCIEGPATSLEARRTALVALMRDELQRLGRPRRTGAPVAAEESAIVGPLSRPAARPLQSAESVAR